MNPSNMISPRWRKANFLSIVAANRENSTVSAPYLFRTYDHLKSANTTRLELNPGPASSIPIWQVARATTAAPTYFEPMKIGDEKFIDGGFGIQANNPSWYAFVEVSQMHGNNEKAIALTCSIGTGIPKKITAFPKTNSLFGKYKTLVRYTVATASDSEMTHNIMLQHTSQIGVGYERFNIEGGIGNIDLGEWKIKKLKNPKRIVNVTLAAIEQATNAYLQQADVRRRLTKVAETLVKRRKERSGHAEWNIVATGHRYHCTIDRCVSSSVYHRTMEELRNHLVNTHADQGFKHPPSTDNEKTMLEWRINRGKILHAD
jgi:hypothetical protein